VHLRVRATCGRRQDEDEDRTSHASFYARHISTFQYHTAVDRSVLDEVIASIAPVDERRREDVLARLGALGAIGKLAAQLAAIRQTNTPPVERKVLVACAADHGDTPGEGGALAIRALAAGRAPLSILARAASARLVIVDSGVRGGGDADFAAAVVPLRVGDGTSDVAHGPAMAEDAAVTAVQTGIALVLSLASQGIDVLAACAVAPGSEAAAARVDRALAAGVAPLDALAVHGGFELGTIAGVALCAAAIRVPIVVGGAGAETGAALARAIAPACAGAIVHAHDVAPSRDAIGAPLALLSVDAAARLAREA
jgi:nicotinate-nucleotide--dimethylbenzimidazole phosphoribosyltransferase